MVCVLCMQFTILQFDYFRGNGYFGIKYRRIKKRRGHKKAIIAIARMMLICIYHMILTGESFHPSDYDELMNPKPRKSRDLTIESAVDFLKNSGTDIDAIIASLKEASPDQFVIQS